MMIRVSQVHAYKDIYIVKSLSYLIFVMLGNAVLKPVESAPKSASFVTKIASHQNSVGVLAALLWRL